MSRRYHPHLNRTPTGEQFWEVWDSEEYCHEGEYDTREQAEAAIREWEAEDRRETALRNLQGARA